MLGWERGGRGVGYGVGEGVGEGCCEGGGGEEDVVVEVEFVVVVEEG